MKNKIINSVKDNCSIKIGVVQARKFTELREILEKRGRVSLAEEDIEKRINPFYLMPEAKSIIVCLFSYFTGLKGKISSYAHGKDYHTVVTDKLKNIAKPLTDSGYLIKCYADNAPLVDRHLAYLCGLGFFGKNGMLINDSLGSEFFIGYILTDCELREDKPLENTSCLGCNMCIKSCPGGALGEDFSFDENKCVSFLTQKKGELFRWEKETIKKSGYVWGCDICRNVCPHNQNIPVTQIGEFRDNLILNPEFDENLSNKEFKHLYGERAFSWRGKGVIQRNMHIYKENV